MLSSYLVPLEIVIQEFRPHLKVMVVHNGRDFTSTAEIRALMNKQLFKQIQEEIMHKSLMRCQKQDDGYGDGDGSTDGYIKPTMVRKRLHRERDEF